MDIFAVCFLSFFAVTGFLLLLERLFYSDLSPDKIIVVNELSEFEAEQLIRSIRYKFPRSEIVVKAKDKAADIAKRMGAVNISQE